MLRLFTLFTLASLTLPCFAQQPTGRGAVFFDVALFDSDGFMDDDGGNSTLTQSTWSAGLGAEAHLLRRTHYTGTLGAALRLARTEAGFGDEDPDPFSSGFRLQHLDLYARLAGNAVAATAGFILDLGPTDIFESPDETTTEQPNFLNSDAQHAVHLGASGEVPSGGFRFHGALDGFFTLPYTFTNSFPEFENPNTLVTVEGEVDFGDTVLLRGGVSHTLGFGHIGLDIAYAVTTEGETITLGPFGLEGEDMEFRDTFEGRSLLSIIPYLTVGAAESPLQVTLAAEAPGGAYSEHVPYGITLLGNNQWKEYLPVSLRVRYGF